MDHTNPERSLSSEGARANAASPADKYILLTGGCGFIGSHCAVELIQKGYSIIIIDNYVNSDPAVLDNIEKITNVKPKFYNCDVTNHTHLRAIFKENNI